MPISKYLFCFGSYFEKAGKRIVSASNKDREHRSRCSDICGERRNVLDDNYSIAVRDIKSKNTLVCS